MRIETGNHLQKEELSKVLDNNCSENLGKLP